MPQFLHESFCVTINMSWVQKQSFEVSYIFVNKIICLDVIFIFIYTSFLDILKCMPCERASGNIDECVNAIHRKL